MPENNISVRQNLYNYSKNMKTVSNRPSDVSDSFQRCVVVYVRAAILYTGVMFLGDFIYLMYKISATVLPSYYSSLEKTLIQMCDLFKHMFFWTLWHLHLLYDLYNINYFRFNLSIEFEWCTQVFFTDSDYFLNATHKTNLKCILHKKSGSG